MHLALRVAGGKFLLKISGLLGQAPHEDSGVDETGLIPLSAKPLLLTNTNAKAKTICTPCCIVTTDCQKRHVVIH